MVPWWVAAVAGLVPGVVAVAVREVRLYGRTRTVRRGGTLDFGAAAARGELPMVFRDLEDGSVAVWAPEWDDAA